jgi:phosphotransferase system  glucose/maltose/N-acetylglucosamine-specific IIC component
MSPSDSIQNLGKECPISVSDDTWANSLYLNLAPESAINHFLGLSGEYNDGKWARLPRTPTRKSWVLRESLCGIIASIIQHFTPKATHATRIAVEARANSFYCESTESSTMSSFPEIVIKASGPSFSTPKMASLGFSNVAACVSVIVKGSPTESHQVARMAGYAK